MTILKSIFVVTFIAVYSYCHLERPAKVSNHVGYAVCEIRFLNPFLGGSFYKRIYTA